MWKAEFARDSKGIPVGKNRFEFFRKKHPVAMAVLETRLQMILTALNAQKPIREILSQGFVHLEPGAVFALSPGQPPLRLYCCLETKTQTLAILTMGDKRRQKEDIVDAVRWANEIRGS